MVQSTTLAKITFETPLRGTVCSALYISEQMGQPQVFINVKSPDTTQEMTSVDGKTFQVAVAGGVRAVCVTRSSFWNKGTREAFWTPLGFTDSVTKGWDELFRQGAEITLSKVDRTKKSAFMLAFHSFRGGTLVEDAEFVEAAKTLDHA